MTDDPLTDDPLTPAERARRYRRRQGIGPRELKPCGTVAAARRHLRHGEELDELCREAWRTRTDIADTLEGGTPQETGQT